MAGVGKQAVKYVRDKRSPKAKNGLVSQLMSANKAKHTSPEVALCASLRHLGARGYSLHAKKVPGRPDIVYRKSKLAVFMHGCYWHHCPKCDLPLPKHNRAFWKAKFTRNQERDKRKLGELKKAGWKSIVVWEHEIRKDPDRAGKRVLSTLNRRTPRSS